MERDMTNLPTEFLMPATSKSDLRAVFFEFATEGFEDSDDWMEALDEKELEEIAAIALNRYNVYEDAICDMPEFELVMRAIIGGMPINDIMLAVAKIRKQLISYGLQIAYDEFQVFIDSFDRKDHEDGLKADEMLDAHQDAWINRLHS
tara:strand:+ start:7031 stop:7474 length:444 start_codon:yes stop_codon:yes gene_type:complete